MENKEVKRNSRKTVVGKVFSSKADKTIVVMVERRVTHPVYGKIIRKSSKFHAHDEKNECNERDVVQIMETRPLSKTKRWRLVKILEKAK